MIDSGTTPTAERLRGHILTALNALPKVKTTEETSDADWKIQQIRMELESLGNTTPGIDISEDEAVTELDRIRADMRTMSGQTDSIKIRAATLEALAALDRFRLSPPPVAEVARYNHDDIATYHDADKPRPAALLLTVLAAFVVGALIFYLTH